jgi:hypothetical protein
MRKLVFILAMTSILGCEESNNETPIPIESNQISTGTSFGMCIGYCYNELLITEEALTHIQRSWTPDSLPEIQRVYEERDVWPNLISSDLWQTFMELPETIGCPDCADGGAEWVEWRSESGTSKKVVFEYGKDVPEITRLLEEIRQIRNTTFHKAE